MNKVTQEKKDSVTKTLAIIGFISAILFAVYLAVQIVSFMPTAFSSLASIADSVYNYKENQELTIATKNSVVNTGEAFTITWTKMNRPGTYAFSYTCTEGTSLDARDRSGDIVSVNCDTSLNLGDNTSVDVILTSEKKRFIDVPFTIVFVPKDKADESVRAQSKVTIVNASIPTSGVIDTTNSQTTTPTGTDDNGATTVTSDNNNTTDNSGLVAGKPKTVKKIIYALPQSDPNGEIDLQVTYIGVGTLTDTTFTRTATIDKDTQGAFRFEVENIGTKTADVWSYKAKLPSGIDYDAGAQKPLKPAEKAMITIGFEGLTQTGLESFGVEVTAKDDVNAKNNSFTWVVEITN